MACKSFSLSLVLCLVGASLLGACLPAARQQIQPLPELRVGVAPFSQPTQTLQLMAGYVPEGQGLASPQDVSALNALFASKLADTDRAYLFPSAEALSLRLAPDSQGRGSVLAAWAEQARAAGADLLIVPQVLDWHDRQGGPAGVTSPASITLDFFLIDARGEALLAQRVHYQEEQTALADNLLSAGDFIARRGRWVTALELAGEGMDKAVRELGLAR